MRQFARRVPVLYVNSLGVSVPARGRSDGLVRRASRKLRSMARYYGDGGDGFRVLSPIYLPGLRGRIEGVADRALRAQLAWGLRAARMLRPLIWVACPTAARVLHCWPEAPVVYQLSDCYSALWGGACGRVAELERAAARRADLLVCSSRRLLQRARELYGHGEYVDHGVDFDLFREAAQAKRNVDELRGVRGPVVGFFGNLDENTIDGDLLDQVVQLRPHYTFILVGTMARGLEKLRRRKNVVAAGQKPYHEVPSYGACFDVCIMPWRNNDWIQHCNPVKLKEYLALGKPVVSTPFPELETCDGLCQAARGPAQFAAAIDHALRTDSPELRAKRQAWTSCHTWGRKFQTVLRHLGKRRIHVCAGKMD